MDNWEPITDVDLTRRTPEEWAKIYNIKLLEPKNGWWNEYEWAYYFDNLYYGPAVFTEDNLPDWDKIAEKELRAAFIKRDLFLNADMGEKEVLKKQYIEPNKIRNLNSRV